MALLFFALVKGTETSVQPDNSVEIVLPEATSVTNSPSRTQSQEAARAHTEALQTISALGSSPTQATGVNTPPSLLSSFIGSFLPVHNQRGPIASALRIIHRLRQQSWMPKSVVFLLNFGEPRASRGRRNEELNEMATKVLSLLEHAIELGNVDALYTMGRVSLFPPAALLRNVTRAYNAFKRHTELTGNATSYSLLGFFHGAGYKPLSDMDNDVYISVDQARALLYYTFAANGGDYGSQMALGYRYWSGIGRWAAMEYFLSGPPGGRTLPLTHTKLSDLVGGVFGPGASVASTGLLANRHVIKAADARAAGETWDDVIDYYQFNADRGEVEFAYRLGKIYYQGSVYPSPGGIASGAEGVGAVTRDYTRAQAYFARIARQLWPVSSVKKRPDLDEQTTLYAVQSACYLGRMLLRGEGVQQDFQAALKWFDRGAEHGDRECHNGLGIMYRDGLGAKKDEKKSLTSFKIAANQDLAEAQVNLGKYHYYRGELNLANTYFDAAMRHGSPFEAFYYIAALHSNKAQGFGSPLESNPGSCPIAVSFYKYVAERGCWKEDLLLEAESFWRAGEEKRRVTSGLSTPAKVSEFTKEHEEALLRWFMAAERGYEIAQNNLAWVLDQDRSSFRNTRFYTPVSNETARIALTHWSRSAAQRNVDALVKVGDYYFYGLGMDKDSESSRLEKAASYYHSAASTQVSAVAMWNLGWMYENGIGVTQDFHLAKRYYDLALETNREAYFPVTLSLIKLHVRSLWNELRGGGKGLTLWRDVDEDEQWHFGKAKEDQESGTKIKQTELNDRGITSGNDDDDPVQWARDRKGTEDTGDFGPEDYFEAATRGRGDTQDSDEFVETMFLILLCILVSGLIYLRGRWVERQRRENNNPPPEDGGLFPPQGDPARQDWAILR
ncbi:hypothetical protein Clacol_002695 [Clathrus columnatus]|uniref:Uncharacterized protein n=1 Tax=Clathrus columnatus TaxID=1419009 RepID=A0AAV5A1G6_9AGAM|nr:hypothetical protein Clacol_002695 [Clathrus columnatus]